MGVSGDVITDWPLLKDGFAADDMALEFGERADHLHDESPLGRRRIEQLGHRDECGILLLQDVASK